MKKIVLLGDSIRLYGYGTKVPALLGGDFLVWQPEDNCRFAKYCTRIAFSEYQNIKDADVIHFNAGLWDVSDETADGQPFTTIDDYEKQMIRLAKYLLSITPNVIFATTTPCKPGHECNRNEVIREYNSRIVPIFKNMGIKINDLYSLVEENIDSYIRDDDKIHLTEIGIDGCAKQVVEHIKNSLK